MAGEIKHPQRNLPAALNGGDYIAIPLLSGTIHTELLAGTKYLVEPDGRLRSM
jgi:hypothetical protein